MFEANVSNEGLDLEWLALILEAMKLGIEKDDVRNFLNNNSIKTTNLAK